MQPTIKNYKWYVSFLFLFLFSKKSPSLLTTLYDRILKIDRKIWGAWRQISIKILLEYDIINRVIVDEKNGAFHRSEYE